MKKIICLLFIAPIFLTIAVFGSSQPKLYLGLITDKMVYKSGEPIAMALTVLNQNSKSYQAQFSSSQIYDFHLYNENQQLVWKWSGDKMFAMSLVNLKLEPKLPLTYVITFNQVLPSGKLLEPGKYKLVGEFCVREKEYLTKPVEIEVRR